jgi:hypothetical protein
MNIWYSPSCFQFRFLFKNSVQEHRCLVTPPSTHDHYCLLNSLLENNQQEIMAAVSIALLL